MHPPIAIVAAACEFPDAKTPQELWQLALHGRQSFRRFPAERLNLAQYAINHDHPDGIYPIEAAFIEGYAFERDRFLVPRTTYAATDMTHWMALDVAERALKQLPHGWSHDTRLLDRTAVIVANTLTGEFSRANLMRYRWPWVNNVVRDSIAPTMSEEQITAFMTVLERHYKAPFPAPDEDSLAGSLSNTIAGRISNHFGLRGGAHTVDGACASSLIAVITACEKLLAGAADCAIVGAVDLSLDPFELVGFARNGALAREEMRVFDRDCEGFWPGEGCGVLILATQALAQQNAWPILGWIRGTGMSTDGKGGLTRPTSDGQLLALQRAWSAAGLDPAAADYFEAHGTGTPTGDPVEITALSKLINESKLVQPIALGSIKANIGHTKAAAGMAGILKGLGICTERIIPATSGCRHPHPLFETTEVKAALQIPRAPSTIRHGNAVVVGVNSFGFGGVNCHVVISGNAASTPTSPACPLPSHNGMSLRGELIAIHAATRSELLARLDLIQERVATLSRAQLADLAASFQPGNGAWRASLVAATPQELEAGLKTLRNSLTADDGKNRVIAARWCWSAPSPQPPRIAFLFPGQGLPSGQTPVGWEQRFPFITGYVARIHALTNIGHGNDHAGTAVIQPQLAEFAMAALAMLNKLGIGPTLALGHSFGELSALHAAGSFDADTFRNLARLRGQIMQQDCPPSSMLAIETQAENALALAAQHDLDIACHNSAQKFVLAGTNEAIDCLQTECDRQHIHHSRLPTSCAFHSRLMQAASKRFSQESESLAIRSPTMPVISSITGQLIGNENLHRMLSRQFIAPVQFAQAVQTMGTVDLVIEAGSGSGLASLLKESGGAECMPLGLFESSLAPLLAVAGAAWVCGCDIASGFLYEGRMIKPYQVEYEPRFLTSPCGQTGRIDPLPSPSSAIAAAPRNMLMDNSPLPNPDCSAFDVLQNIICDLAALPRAHIGRNSLMLTDLHLNSIRARHVVAKAAQQLDIQGLPFNPGELVNASLADIAEYLEKLRAKPDLASQRAQGNAHAKGVTPWIRYLSHRWQEAGQLAINQANPDLHFCLDDTLAPLDNELATAASHLFGEDHSLPTMLLLPVFTNSGVGHRLLASARELAGSAKSGLLVFQGKQIANAFLQSASAEMPDKRICVVEYEAMSLATLRRGMAQYCQRHRGYAEVRLRADRIQIRQANVFWPERKADQWLPGPDDVVLISGGAKGIGAATALFLSQHYGCRLALLGRSPASDPAVAASLAQLAAIGGQYLYVQLDLTDAQATHLAVREIENALGSITMLVHAAGINRPARVNVLTESDLDETVAAKTTSLDALLAALRAGQLRLLVAYCSIIGEFGLQGEAHYALANEWLSLQLHEHASLAGTRCLPLCWSAWRETGMATRLDGVLDNLENTDTRALNTDEALDMLRQLLESSHQSEALIVTGRYGRIPDAMSEVPVFSRHRFLETARVFYPGIELVADAEVSTDLDLYLLDHAPYGLPVFPLVAAIEAMVAAVQCLSADFSLPVMADLRIGNAISCAPGQAIILRTAVLKLNDEAIHATLRAGSTDFSEDHFSCTFHKNNASAQRLSIAPAPHPVSATQAIYGGLTFHGPMFRYLHEYHRIGALECVATTATAKAKRWYSPLKPATLCAGDMGLRDAAIHALQVCIPMGPVLPVGVAHLALGKLRPDQVHFISACQTSGNGTEFTFDVDILNQAGDVVERWIGLRLMRIKSAQGDLSQRHSIEPALLEAFVGRLLLDYLHTSNWKVGLCHAAPGEARPSSIEVVHRTLGKEVVLTHDADGAPRVADGFISIAHTEQTILAVAHQQKKVACDIEAMPDYSPEEWQLILGQERHAFANRLATNSSLNLQQACLVTWTASECLQKLGHANWPSNLKLARTDEPSYTGTITLLATDDIRIVSGFIRITNQCADTAIAVALQEPFPGSATIVPATNLLFAQE